MKLIIAIIQPTKLEAVKEALSRVEVFRLTVMDVQGFGRQKGYTEVYRGHEVTVNLLRKIELQIAVNEDFIEPTVNAIMEAGRSGPDGKIGDGKIFILPRDDCIRFCTGVRGPVAICRFGSSRRPTPWELRTERALQLESADSTWSWDSVRLGRPPCSV